MLGVVRQPRNREFSPRRARSSGRLRRAAAAFVEDAEREPEWTRLFSEFAALASERPELRAALANGFSLERLADPTLPPELFPRTIELIIAGLEATEHGQR